MDFISVTSTFREASQVIANFIQAWKYFCETEVVVGITQDSDVGRGGITNAQLLYLHEHGIPSHNVPARPALKPALRDRDVQSKIAALMTRGMTAALLTGNKDLCEQMYEKAGMLGRDAVKKYIVDGIPPPNSPETVARKGSSTPLIDKGSMLNSITYEVRKKKG